MSPGRFATIQLLALGLLAPTLHAQSTSAPNASETRPTAPRPGTDEEIGTWRFKTKKPVQAIVLGGSVAAYTGGNFGDALGEICANVEIRNIAKTGYGAWALKKRFQAQVLKNRRVRRTPPETERWLIFHGGLNSVGNP